MTQHSSTTAAAAGRTGKNGWKRIQILLWGVVVVALCVAIRHFWSASPAHADPSGRNDATSLSIRPSHRSADGGRDAVPQDRQDLPESSERETPSPDARNHSDSPIPAVVAAVNTKRITREDLARDCLRHFGKEVLESMVNKRLIMLECQRRGITVSRDEVSAEIEDMAKRFKIPVEQWLKMLKQERNVSSQQYAEDIIWPTLALRKLAGSQLTVSEKEIRAEFDTQYGEQIRVRLIAADDPQAAEALRAKAVAHPADFGDLAKQYSKDSASASVKGIINPIRRHGSYQEIEDAVFSMKDGEITPVIHAGDKYVFLKREQAIPPREVDYNDVVPSLRAFLRDRKMRSIAQDVFHNLQKRAADNKAVQNVWNDPARRQQMPGVAATVYNDQITIRELAEQCVTRHGPEVLEGTINRTLIELECKRQGITATDDDVEREIERMALSGVKTKPDGSADVQAWLDLITKKGISLEVYRHDGVWPTVAMKKLVGDTITVSKEDVQKGYEANYGERVRCLAIVLNDVRKAQQVFELARKNNTAEYFGKLAAQYSVEPGSQALQGEVPPIRRHGGQPTLEEEAFNLKPGELSGVIQVGDKFIILRCEGRTEPVKVDFASAREEIYRDLFEKKLQLAMRERFEAMQESATIDNYLSNTSHSPKPAKGRQAAAHLPTLRELPSR
jgi:parvulin-like peptidyl-prolyl isomerase